MPLLTAAAINNTLAKINEARTKWGLTAGSQIMTPHMTLYVQGHVQNMKTWLEQANTQSGAGQDLSGVTGYAAHKDVYKQSILDILYSKATTIKDYCPCNCNNCPCNCNNCPCNCDYCPCDCDYCPCDCDYCPCDCNYCCDNCTCNCDYCCDNCACNCDYCCDNCGNICCDLYIP